MESVFVKVAKMLDFTGKTIDKSLYFLLQNKTMSIYR